MSITGGPGRGVCSSSQKAFAAETVPGVYCKYNRYNHWDVRVKEGVKEGLEQRARERESETARERASE